MTVNGADRKIVDIDTVMSLISTDDRYVTDFNIAMTQNLSYSIRIFGRKITFTNNGIVL